MIETIEVVARWTEFLLLTIGLLYLVAYFVTKHRAVFRSAVATVLLVTITGVAFLLLLLDTLTGITPIGVTYVFIPVLIFLFLVAKKKILDRFEEATNLIRYAGV